MAGAMLGTLQHGLPCRNDEKWVQAGPLGTVVRDGFPEIFNHRDIENASAGSLPTNSDAWHPQPVLQLQQHSADFTTRQ